MNFLSLSSRRKTLSEIEEDRIWNGTDYKSYPGPQKEDYPVYPLPLPQEPVQQQEAAKPCMSTACMVASKLKIRPIWSLVNLPLNAIILQFLNNEDNIVRTS